MQGFDALGKGICLFNSKPLGDLASDDNLNGNPIRERPDNPNVGSACSNSDEGWTDLAACICTAA
jgi:hypothetical protein